MTLNVFISPTEIRDFFQKNGFTVIESDFGSWENSYHNKTEWITRTRDAVVIGDKQIRADLLFNRISEYRIKQILTPQNKEAKMQIEIAFKQCLKTL